MTEHGVYNKTVCYVIVVDIVLNVFVGLAKVYI